MKAERIFWMIITVFLSVQTITLKQKYQDSEKEWERLSKVWREKLDTCMERNARIYDQLYKYQDIRIQQLKDEKKGK